jgi:hypothetical protein
VYILRGMGIITNGLMVLGRCGCGKCKIIFLGDKEAKYSEHDKWKDVHRAKFKTASNRTIECVLMKSGSGLFQIDRWAFDGGSINEPLEIS